MKIAYNPEGGETLLSSPLPNDIIFDLSGRNIWVKGVKFNGIDYKIFEKATENNNGITGLVPAPSYSADNIRFLNESGSWEAIRITTNDIYSLNNYTKENNISSLSTEDTLNTALSKLECKIDSVYNWYISITEEDTDTIINKWGEIVNFIKDVDEGTDILSKFITTDTNLIISGKKIFTNPPHFIGSETTSPFIVNNSTLITNLNADLLDGKHIDDFILKTDITNYYWANVNISNSSSINTEPIFKTATSNIFKVLNENSGVVNIQCGTNTTTDYTLYLPAANGELVYHDNNTAVGGTTTPTYIDSSGKVKSCTYSLKASINSGYKDKLAYYSSTNTIDDYTSTVGNTSKPIYINAGVPTKCSAESTTTTIYILGSASNGEGLYTGTRDTTGVRVVSGSQVWAYGGFYESSDNRLKNFISDIDIDLEKLSLLPKKYFTWKSDETNELNIGTSAQELQKLYPELVKEEDGILHVAYDKLSIIALKAIDKLYEKIKDLENQINKLK